MFENEIGRAKDFTLLHLFYCVISVSSLVIYDAINGLPKDVGHEGLDVALKILMQFIYFFFCSVWCINDGVALLAINKKKHCLVLCYVIFGFTIVLFAVLILIFPSYIIAYCFVLHLMRLFRTGTLDKNFIGNSLFGYMTLFTVMIFLGTLLSSFSLYYLYQSKKEFPTSDTTAPNVQENIESNDEVDKRIEKTKEPMKHGSKLASKQIETED